MSNRLVLVVSRTEEQFRNLAAHSGLSLKEIQRVTRGRDLRGVLPEALIVVPGWPLNFQDHEFREICRGMDQYDMRGVPVIRLESDWDIVANGPPAFERILSQGKTSDLVKGGENSGPDGKLPELDGGESGRAIAYKARVAAAMGRFMDRQAEKGRG